MDSHEHAKHAKVLILGSGPAGYTAAIYAARAMLKPVLIQGIQPGGQLTITTDVENYPGFAKVIQGPWLMEEMQGQAEHVGTEMVMDHIAKVDLKRRPFRLEGDCGDIYTCDALIICTGAQARWLGIPPSERLQGLRRLRLRHLRRLLLQGQGGDRGRRRQHRGRGGDLPHQLREQGHRRASPRQLPRREDHAGAPVQEPEDRGGLGHARSRRSSAAADPKTVTGVQLKNVKTGAITERKVDGVFIAIGHAPATELFKGQLEMKPSGYLITKPDSTATSIPGVFAAGDVKDDIFRQAVTAAGMGCMAALEAERWLPATPRPPLRNKRLTATARPRPNTGPAESDRLMARTRRASAASPAGP